MDPWRAAYTLLKCCGNKRALRRKWQDYLNQRYNRAEIIVFFFSDYVCRRLNFQHPETPFQQQDYLKVWIPCVVISARWSLPARDIWYWSTVVTGSRFLCIRETLRRRFERLGRLLRYFFKSPSGKCWKYKENTAGNFKASKQNNKASSENTQNQLKYQENLCKIMKNHQKTVKFDKKRARNQAAKKNKRNYFDNPSRQ